jgi:hypothetical protein
MQPPTPNDFEAAGPLFEKLVPAIKWLGTVLVGGWVFIKVVASFGMQARRYQELREDIDGLHLKSTSYVTKDEHVGMSALCREEIERMVDNRLHDAVIEMRDQMDVMNANLCRIMGSMEIDPVDRAYKRRRTADREK